MPRVRPKSAGGPRLPQDPGPILPDDELDTFLGQVLPEDVKDAGNELFRNGRVEEAADMYLQAIELVLLDSDDLPLKILGSLCEVVSQISQLGYPAKFFYNGAFVAFAHRPVSGPKLHKVVCLSNEDGSQESGLWPLAVLHQGYTDALCEALCDDPDCFNNMVSSLAEQSEKDLPGVLKSITDELPEATGPKATAAQTDFVKLLLQNTLQGLRSLATPLSVVPESIREEGLSLSIDALQEHAQLAADNNLNIVALVKWRQALAKVEMLPDLLIDLSMALTKVHRPQLAIIYAVAAIACQPCNPKAYERVAAACRELEWAREVDAFTALGCACSSEGSECVSLPAKA